MRSTTSKPARKLAEILLLVHVTSLLMFSCSHVSHVTTLAERPPLSVFFS
jgi:hypothetical protein